MGSASKVVLDINTTPYVELATALGLPADVPRSEWVVNDITQMRERLQAAEDAVAQWLQQAATVKADSAKNKRTMPSPTSLQAQLDSTTRLIETSSSLVVDVTAVCLELKDVHVNLLSTQLMINTCT